MPCQSGGGCAASTGSTASARLRRARCVHTRETHPRSTEPASRRRPLEQGAGIVGASAARARARTSRINQPSLAELAREALVQHPIVVSSGASSGKRVDRVVVRTPRRWLLSEARARGSRAARRTARGWAALRVGKPQEPCAHIHGTELRPSTSAVSTHSIPAAVERATVPCEEHVVFSRRLFRAVGRFEQIEDDLGCSWSSDFRAPIAASVRFAR